MLIELRGDRLESWIGQFVTELEEMSEGDERASSYSRVPDNTAH